MTAEVHKKSQPQTYCIASLSVPRWLMCLYVIILNLAYVVIRVHTPVTLYPGAIHDDGLFIRLGRSLADWHWLGDFNQFTLMKGPGYPAFLAVANWLGISVSMAHALFHCFAITFFVVVCHRFIKSSMISGVFLFLLLWHPISLSGDMLRVSRDEIYYGQTLLMLGTILWVLFGPVDTTRRLMWAGVAGAVLGWFWLTREEGLWILPGLLLLVLVAGLHAFRLHRIRKFTLLLLVATSVFGATQLGFSFVNRHVYGKFVAVDVKESNFRRALEAIDSVRSGGTKPFVSITHAAMQRVDAVSPAFASLASYFDGPGKNWETWGCQENSRLCGEIGSAWFLWALRDAVAATGHFASPSEASAFFGRIADEISAACQHGSLECYPQFIAEMPPISWSDVWKLLLPRSANALELLILYNPPYQINPSNGTEDLLEPALWFLNYPLHTKSSDSTWTSTYVFTGWYYRSGNDWLSAEVISPTKGLASFQFDRQSSPDIQSGFKDLLASNQRFTLQTRCGDGCVLVLRAPTGEVVERKLLEYRKAPLDIDLGTGHVHFDSANVVSDSRYFATPLDRLCTSLRVTIMKFYSWLFLPILVFGLLAFVASAIMLPGRVPGNLSFVTAALCWGLVLSRAALLLLIDVTSFPALNGTYFAPAYYLLAAAAVLSIAAWTHRGTMKQISAE
jgi:hypothetical protein